MTVVHVVCFNVNTIWVGCSQRAARGRTLHFTRHGSHWPLAAKTGVISGPADSTRATDAGLSMAVVARAKR